LIVALNRPIPIKAPRQVLSLPLKDGFSETQERLIERISSLKQPPLTGATFIIDHYLASGSVNCHWR
jgi:hypothetical protein